MAKRFSDDPTELADLADLTALADLEPGRGHADWRNEILSFLLYPADREPSWSVVTRLRPAI